MSPPRRQLPTVSIKAEAEAQDGAEAPSKNVLSPFMIWVAVPLISVFYGSPKAFLKCWPLAEIRPLVGMILIMPLPTGSGSGGYG